jgi:hypothetical protein
VLYAFYYYAEPPVAIAEPLEVPLVVAESEGGFSPATWALRFQVIYKHFLPLLAH